jgi:hypothetical protein
MNTKILLNACALLFFLSVPDIVLCMKAITDTDVEQFLELIEPWKDQENRIKEHQLTVQNTKQPITVTIGGVKTVFYKDSVVLSKANRSDELSYAEFLNTIVRLNIKDTLENVATKKSKKQKRKWCCFK